MDEPGQPVNFDEWRSLARRDPEGFESARRRVLDALIAQAPEKRRRRLQAIQWRVDRVRERSANPLAACISLSDMMWESFAGENGLLDALRGGPGPAHHDSPDYQSPVVPLHKNGQRKR